MGKEKKRNEKKEIYYSPKIMNLGSMVKMTLNGTGSKCDTGQSGGTPGTGTANCHP